MGLEHYGTAIQLARDTMGLLHNGTVTQWDWNPTGTQYMGQTHHAAAILQIPAAPLTDLKDCEILP